MSSTYEHDFYCLSSVTYLAFEEGENQAWVPYTEAEAFLVTDT